MIQSTQVQKCSGSSTLAEFPRQKFSALPAELIKQTIKSGGFYEYCPSHDRKKSNGFLLCQLGARILPDSYNCRILECCCKGKIYLKCTSKRDYNNESTRQHQVQLQQYSVADSRLPGTNFPTVASLDKHCCPPGTIVANSK